MKALKSILILGTMLLTFDVHAQSSSLPAGFEYTTSGAEYEAYFSAKKNAIALIRNASKNPGNNLNANAVEFGEKVIHRLLSSKFAISTNATSESKCSNNDMFVTPKYPDVIFICNVTRNAIASGDNKNLLIASQILIHEGAHLVEHAKSAYTNVTPDECRPTYFELVIMENNFGKHNIPNMGNRDAYKAQCGFAEYDDVPSKSKKVAGVVNQNSRGSR